MRNTEEIFAVNISAFIVLICHTIIDSDKIKPVDMEKL
jgi:hypothetical protein